MPNVFEKNQHVNSYNHACASGSFFTHWVWLHFEVRVWCENAALDDGGEKCWVKSWHVLWATRLAPPLTDVLPNMITTPLEGSNNPTCSLHQAILRIINVIYLFFYQIINQSRVGQSHIFAFPVSLVPFEDAFSGADNFTLWAGSINLALTFYKQRLHAKSMTRFCGLVSQWNSEQADLKITNQLHLLILKIRQGKHFKGCFARWSQNKCLYTFFQTC